MTQASGKRFLLGCPCGYRPPRTDDIDSWLAWYEHLEQEHPLVREGESDE